MVRRIVKCSSCLKRFATASGQDLCPSCRPPPINNDVVSAAANTTEEEEQKTASAALQSQKRPPLPYDHHDSSRANNQFSWKKRKQQSTTTTIADDVVVCNNNVATAAASSIQQPSAVVNDENDTVNNNDSEINKLIPTNKSPAQDIMSSKKKPKTRSVGDDETKIFISTSSNSTAPESFDEDELFGNDDHYNGHYEDNDDLHCSITNSSKNGFNDDELESSEEANNHKQLKREIDEDDGSCCGSENDDLLDGNTMECIEIDEEDNTTASDEEEEVSQQPPPQVNHKEQLTEKNDVCYICGTNLSGKGFQNRVAHMKRCSTKYNGQAMKSSSDMIEEEMELFESSSKTVLSNPYNASTSQWHGGGANKPVQQPSSKEKQSMLNQFFKGPVRSLTNVLMAGSRRQASKKKVETTLSSLQNGGLKSSAAVTNNTGNKTTYRKKGSWAASSSNNNRRGGLCPSYKRIPGTDFLCDGFYYASGSLTQNYFLTHFHSDHYGGITKKWNEGIIYCSLPTANLVHQNLGVEQKYLHPLPMNEPTVIFSKDKAVKVTLLDANHCPGAVMFLFEIGNRRILHVGDFRWNQTIMLDIPQIRALSTMNPRLDELYLDTTYCNPKYELPTQEEAIAAAIDVASEEMQKSKRGSKTLFLFGSYTIGKEKIYLSVAQHLKQKVYVDSRRLRILKALDWPDERMSIFTTKKEETCLWVVPLGKVNFKDMPDFLEQANKNKAGKALTAKYERVVGFRPTGWTYTAKDKKQTLLPCGKPKPSHLISSKTNGKFSVHGVPYSEHSSFPELVDCIRCLKPRKIVTTVSPSKSEEQIELLLNAANALE